MEVRRLRMLVELDRRGTMAAVAAATGYSTSAVSHQLAVLEREAGCVLVEPAGRRVRLTPAGRRLVRRAETVIATIEAARAELGDTEHPAGTVRIASAASAVPAILLPIMRQLRDHHPRIEVAISEAEPAEVVQRLQDDDDLGIVYDYSIRPRFVPDGQGTVLIGHEPIYLVAPADAGVRGPIERPADLLQVSSATWITNARGVEDDELTSRLCGLAGFKPRMVHRADSYELLGQMVAAGLGVAFVPALALAHAPDGVACQRLAGIPVRRRIFLLTRPGRADCPPVAMVRTLIREEASRLAEVGPADLVAR